MWLTTGADTNGAGEDQRGAAACDGNAVPREAADGEIGDRRRSFAAQIQSVSGVEKRSIELHTRRVVTDSDADIGSGDGRERCQRTDRVPPLSGQSFRESEM